MLDGRLVGPYIAAQKTVDLHALALVQALESLVIACCEKPSRARRASLTPALVSRGAFEMRTVNASGLLLALMAAACAAPGEPPGTVESEEFQAAEAAVKLDEIDP